MISWFAAAAGVVFGLALMLVKILLDPQEKALFATLSAGIAWAVVLNALGDLADEWLIALMWAVVGVVATRSAVAHRKRAAEQSPTPKHKEVP